MLKIMMAVGAAALVLATPSLAGPGGEHDNDDGQHKDHGEHSHFEGGGGHDDGDEDSHFEGGYNRGGDEGESVWIRRGGDEEGRHGDTFARHEYSYGQGRHSFPLRYGAALQRDYAEAYLPGQYRDWYPDNNRYYYRYGEGYAYRVNRSDNLISGLFPLAGGDYYAPGERYPTAYDFYNVPQPYQGYYPDNGSYNYRYGDGAIYQVNRSNGLIESIVALLTGVGIGKLGIGQRLPMGYDVYNVPDAFRDRYYDTSAANYRYANGNIYQVDPKTQLIQQIMSALI